jgi:hypothetical protein
MIVDDVLVTEILDYILSILEHPLWPWTDYTLDACDHTLNVVVKEEDVLCPKFSQDAA